MIACLNIQLAYCISVKSLTSIKPSGNALTSICRDNRDIIRVILKYSVRQYDVVGPFNNSRRVISCDLHDAIYIYINRNDFMNKRYVNKFVYIL